MGIIYFIKCKDTGEVYIGSTKRKLNRRMSYHKCHRNNCKSKEIIERGNYHYDTLEVVEDDKDILIRENYYIKTMKNCINEIKAYQSPEERKEYMKEWKKENKEQIREYQKEYDKIRNEYKSSWGGDPRYHNNLLKIDINLFHDR